MYPRCPSLLGSMNMRLSHDITFRSILYFLSTFSFYICRGISIFGEEEITWPSRDSSPFLFLNSFFVAWVLPKQLGAVKTEGLGESGAREPATGLKCNEEEINEWIHIACIDLRSKSSCYRASKLYHAFKLQLMILKILHSATTYILFLDPLCHAGRQPSLSL